MSWKMFEDQEAAAAWRSVELKDKATKTIAANQSNMDQLLNDVGELKRNQSAFLNYIQRRQIRRMHFLFIAISIAALVFIGGMIWGFMKRS